MSTILAGMPSSPPLGFLPVGALQPPPGVTPNFVGPESLQTLIITSGVVAVVLTTSTTLLRVYTKLFVMKRHGWEDYTVFVAWLGFIPYVGIGFASLPYGAGRHQWDVPLLNLVHFGELGSILAILWPLLSLFAKLSILLQYIRIFVPNRGKMYYLVHSFIWINIIIFSLQFFLAIFQCTPRTKLWDPSLPGQCINWLVDLTVTGVFNLISDFCILIMPFAWIWRLQISRRRKLGVSAIFMIGVMACAITTVRLVWSIRVYGDPDLTYILSILVVCSGSEVAAGILVSNLPIMPRFCAHLGGVIKRAFSSRKPSEGRNSSIPGKPAMPWAAITRPCPLLTLNNSNPYLHEQIVNSSSQISPLGISSAHELWSPSSATPQHEGADLEHGIVKTVEIHQEESFHFPEEQPWLSHSGI